METRTPPSFALDPPRGSIVPGRPPADPAPVILAGRRVRLCPPDAPKDSRDLYGPTHGPDAARLWAYLGSGPFRNAAALEADLVRVVKQNGVFFSIRDLDDRTRGRMSLISPSRHHRRIEFGGTLFEPSFARTPAATEASFLVLEHAFDGLGYRRVEARSDALNAPSRAFLQRLGFRLEGVFAKHMIVKHRSRDTAFYAMTDDDWPRVKAALTEWLSLDNFDADDVQMRRLADVFAATGAG